jgi:hypothetical protein
MQRRAFIINLSLLLSFTSVIVGSNASLMATLLVGWTGDGKTWFCNHFDSMKDHVAQPCGKESPRGSGETTTVDPFYGSNFIDSPGWGGNDDENTTTYLAINSTVRAVHDHTLRALMWIYPCTKNNPDTESLRFVKLVQHLTSNNVPLVVMFNPGSSVNECTILPDAFRKVLSLPYGAVADYIYGRLLSATVYTLLQMAFFT